jgi:hypothetical protein
MGLLVYTIIEAPARGWTSTASLLGFAGAAVLLIAFIVGERRTGQPMLDVRLFTNMRFSAASAAVTVAFFTLFGFIFLMTQYFQFVQTYSPLSTGVHLLPVAISVAVGSTAGTRLAVRLGTKRWLLTENVKDFRPIMLRALSAGPPGCGLLFTSSRAFPRSRKNPGPLIMAFHAWLTAGPPAPPVTESWLLGASDSL